MNITQETLINQIAAGEAIPAEMVRQTLKSAENIIFNYFSSVPPSEEVNIKLFPGLSMKRNYIETRKYSKGMFRNIIHFLYLTISRNNHTPSPAL